MNSYACLSNYIWIYVHVKIKIISETNDTTLSQCPKLRFTVGPVYKVSQSISWAANLKMKHIQLNHDNLYLIIP